VVIVRAARYEVGIVFGNAFLGRTCRARHVRNQSALAPVIMIITIVATLG